MESNELVEIFRKDSQFHLQKNLQTILNCLDQLSDEDIWWRPNPASNAAGNLVLHLAGNVRQRIVSWIGGEQDIRQRDREFTEKGPVSRKKLVTEVKSAVDDACNTIEKLPEETFAHRFNI